MRIESYFQHVRETLEACLFIQSSNVTYDKRSTHEGLIRAEIYFIDGSVLYFREFVDVEIHADRLLYVYQYLDPAQHLIFRYDDTGHHKKLNLPTYPHHKHDGNEENIVASHAPDLLVVLEEVEAFVRLP